MDAEITTELNIESAVKHARESNRHLFVAGYQAAKVYGKYQESATAEIARRAGVTEEAVRHWVMGYKCFALLCKYDSNLSCILRREFTITHFYIAYDASEKYNLVAEDIVYILLELLQHKRFGDRWSVQSLNILISKHLAERDIKEQSLVDWHYHFKRVFGILKILSSFDGSLPPRVSGWVKEGLELQER